MIILAIETSCDDTCIAIIKSKSQNPKSKVIGTNFEILSNVVSSQVKLHAKYGGVWPYLAKREHQRNLPIVLKKALRKAGFLNSKFQISIFKQVQNSKIKNIDLIAVTVGPGLEPCLWMGVNFAKELAKKLKAPLIPVNHIEAHIYANFINSNTKYKIQNTKYLFPAICLVVSGGHTQLILMKDFGKYKILGETRDDAAGECLDKTARILGLGYPGGPAIAAEAARFKIKDLRFKVKLPRSMIYQKNYSKRDVIPLIKRFKWDVIPLGLPRPMIYQKNYDFSFSGLKTAVLYNFRSQLPEIRKSKKYIQAMAAEIQQATIDVLIHKTLKAAKDYKAKSIILGGGVAANQELRKQFQLTINKQQLTIKFLVPPKIFCTDNAVMVATAAYFQRLKGAKYESRDIEVDANLGLK